MVMFLALTLQIALLATSVSATKNYSWADMAGGENTDVTFLNELQDAQSGKGSSLVIYGDSKLACLQFDAWGCEGVSAVKERRYNKYNPLVFAVGGDSPASVMGKLLKGIAPKNLSKDGHNIAVAINIGHNGPWKEDGLNVTGDYITQIMEYILDLDPHNEVIWIENFPDSVEWVGSGMYEPSKTIDGMMKDFVKNNNRAHFANCEPLFLDKDDPRFTNGTLMPDYVHLGAKGYAVLADCLDPIIKEIRQNTPDKTSTNKTSITSGSSNTPGQTTGNVSAGNKSQDGTTTSTATKQGLPTPSASGSKVWKNNSSSAVDSASVGDSNGSESAAGEVEGGPKESKPSGNSSSSKQGQTQNQAQHQGEGQGQGHNQNPQSHSQAGMPSGVSMGSTNAVPLTPSITPLG